MTKSTAIPNSVETPVFPPGVQKILIVDDKAANLFALENVLSHLDAEVIRAESGQAALAQVLEHDFSVIILDVRMPGMDGYEVAGHLKGDPQTKTIPIIFVTAEYPDEEHISKGYEFGAIDYLLKPYSPKILLSKVQVLLEMDRNKKELQLHRDSLKEEVQKTQAILKAAMEQSPAGIAIADVPDGKLRYVNKAGLMIRGSSEEEIVHEVGVKEYVESWRLYNLDGTSMSEDEVPLARAVKYGESLEKEFIIRRDKSDDRIVLAKAAPIKDAKGEISAAIVVFLDITDRKQATAKQELLMAAVTQSGDTIVITDHRARIEYVNPAFEKLTGYTSEEVIGRNPRILQSGIHKLPFYQEMWKQLVQGNTWTGRMINHKKDGSRFTEDVTISPVKDASGKIVNYVAVKKDVTNLISLEEQIRQAQKMESIGQLVAGVAHDFNNLLQIINGFSEIAHLMMEADHPASEKINEVLHAGARAKDLVRQLLTFSRQQVIEPVELDLNKEVEHTRKMIGRLIGEHILFDFIAGENLGRIYADKSQINQLLINLCVNARDAMPEGGTLTIQTENVMFDPLDHPSLLEEQAEPGLYALLTVTDTGCGMDEETRIKIFEPFFSTKAPGRGTGLGLSTVFGIIKQNKGHIEVSSRPGKGSSFRIYLPVFHALPSEELNEITEESPLPKGGDETILLVEDEAILLNLAEHILKKAGYTVITATNGIEAVQAFKNHSREIDLLMMDVVMPHMGGKQAMHEILQIRPEVKYMFVSGYSGDAGHIDFIKGKEVHLLSKPYRSETLLKRIRSLLNQETS